IQYLAKNGIRVQRGANGSPVTFSKRLEPDVFTKIAHELICGYRDVESMNRAIDKSSGDLDFFGYGPRSLAQMYREFGGHISGFIEDYLRVFGERPEKLG
ncbi:MAG TPA: hypothetical protein VMC07_01120, partial [Candidatus Omnitrophota bacterium]|nr:hypothetical protein [Candidatus Omnitrophota bacterium]